MSYDDWLTTEPPQERSAPALKYRCLDCAWRGRGVEAFDHHKVDHHRLMLPTGLIAIFSYCDHEATGMPLVQRKVVA